METHTPAQAPVLAHPRRSLAEKFGPAAPPAPSAQPTPPALSSGEQLFVNGFGADLISVIPPDAPISPTSKIPAAARGKAPGLKRRDTWSGYDWRKHQATLDDVRRWGADRANIGLRADKYPGVDLDALDPAITEVLKPIALSTLGPAPCRVGRAPKCLLMYRLADGAAPIGRMRMLIQDGEHKHLLELLSSGQQYLVDGEHPLTRKPYSWDRDVAEVRADQLTPITREKAEAYFVKAQAALEMLGYSVERTGNGGGADATPAANQHELRAPSIEELQRVVDALPNDDLDYDSYVKHGYAIRAAAGEDEEDGYAVFASWAERSSKYDAETTRGDWRRFKPPFKVGYPWLCEQARGHGLVDAGNVLDALPGAEPPDADDPTPPSLRAGIDALNARHAVIGGTIWTMQVGEEAPRPMRSEAFRQHYANRFTAPTAGQKPVSLASAWLRSPKRQTFERVEFDPTKPPYAGFRAANGDLVYNLWPGWGLTPKPGDCSLFQRHLCEVISGGVPLVAEWVEQWCAHIFQRPEKKTGTALLLIGETGVGKSFFGETLGRLLGPRLDHTFSNPKVLTGQFNVELQGRLLVRPEEATFGGDPTRSGPLKDFVTGRTLRVEPKGLESYSVPNYARVLMTANPSYAIAAGPSERRYCVLTPSEAHQKDDSWFGPMYEQLENGGYEALLHHFLFNVKIDWRFISRPLATAALRDQQIQGLTRTERWWFDILAEGVLPGDQDGSGVVPAARLRESYMAALRGPHDRPSDVAMGMFLKKQAVETGRLSDAGRSRVYRVPCLNDARARFAKPLSTPPEWPEQDGWQPDNPFGGVR